MLTFHRRPLPADLISFVAPEGRRLMREALAAGDAEAFFPLIAHFHTQAEPAWCGLGTLVTVLNALDIDPGRTWKGSWRWFGEELLDCCKALEQTTAEGITLTELACLARCNGADVEVQHATPESLPAFREALAAACRAPDGPFLVVNYARAALGQTGDGHFSPVGAWHEGEDRLLVLDVARFKYPPHWVKVESLWAAMTALDPSSNEPRGWATLKAAAAPPPTRAEIEAFREKLQVLSARPVPCCPPAGANA